MPTIRRSAVTPSLAALVLAACASGARAPSASAAATPATGAGHGLVRRADASRLPAPWTIHEAEGRAWETVRVLAGETLLPCGTVSGFVHMAGSGAGMEGSTVTLAPAGAVRHALERGVARGMSDRSGHFELRPDRPGDALIVAVTAEGHGMQLGMQPMRPGPDSAYWVEATFTRTLAVGERSDRLSQQSPGAGDRFITVASPRRCRPASGS